MKMEKNKSNGTENQSQDSNGLADLKNENEVTYCLELFYWFWVTEDHYIFIDKFQF